MESIALLSIGRLLTGVSGTFSNMLPVFVAECSPDDIRPVMSMLVTVGVPVWTTIAALGGLLALHSPYWMWSLAVPVVPALVHMLAAWRVHESPKHLYMSGAMKRAETIQSIEFYRGSATEFAEVERLYSREMALTSQNARVSDGQY